VLGTYNNHCYTYTSMPFIKYSVRISRRMIIPFEKKKKISEFTFPILLLRKTTTNYFISLSFHGIVLFSCSSGSAGMRKKYRRRHSSADVMGVQFCKFIRYFYKKQRTLFHFRNMIVVLSAPIWFFKSFIRRFRRYYRRMCKFLVFTHKRKARKMLIEVRSRIFPMLLNRGTILRSLRKIARFVPSNSNYKFNSKALRLIHSCYKLTLPSLLQYSLLGTNMYYSTYMSSNPLHSFLSILRRQVYLRCSYVSNPPKSILVRLLARYSIFTSYVNKKYTNYMLHNSVYSNFSSLLDVFFHRLKHFICYSHAFHDARITYSIYTEINAANDAKSKSKSKPTLKPKDRYYSESYFRRKISSILSRSVVSILPQNIYSLRLFNDVTSFLRNLYIHSRLDLIYISHIIKYLHNIKWRWNRYYKVYISIIRNRLFASFLSCNVKWINPFLSNDSFLFSRKLINISLSISYRNFIRFVYPTGICMHRAPIISYYKHWAFVNHNLWLYSISFFIPHKYSQLSFFDTLCVYQSYYLWSIFYNMYIPFTRTNCLNIVNTVNTFNTFNTKLIKYNLVSDYYLIRNDRLCELPKTYLSSLVRIDNRLDAFIFVAECLYNNSFILREWYDFIYFYISIYGDSVFTSSTFTGVYDVYDTHTNNHISSLYDRYIFRYFSIVVFYYYDYSYVRNVYIKLFTFMKHKILQILIDYVITIIFLNKYMLSTCWCFIFIRIFITSMLLLINWSSYLYSFHVYVHKSIHSVSTWTKKLLFINQTFNRQCIKYKKFFYLYSKNTFLSNVFLMHDRSVLPYNGCRSRCKWG
jgi:hypothetical protein